MKLLIATPLYPPEPGGPATYAHLLEKEFPYPVSVVKFSDVRQYPKLFRHTAYFLQVYRAAKGADIVLALDPVSVGLPASFAARLRRKPFVVKIVGDYAWEQGVQRFGITDTLDVFVRRARVPFMVAVFRSVQVHVAKSAKKVIVPSAYLKGIVQKWGVPEANIEVIYNAIQLEEGGEVPPKAAAQPRPRIVTACRLVPWKGIEGLVDAVAKLAVPASLTVIGDGPERARLEAYAHKKLDGWAVFTGACTHADTLATMRDADIFVLNSSYEGLSHVLIEALMLGCAVIATDVGGNAELITSGENGMLVPAGDTSSLAEVFEALFADRVRVAPLRAAARTSSARFSTSRMIEHTAAFLSTLTL